MLPDKAAPFRLHGIRHPGVAILVKLPATLVDDCRGARSTVSWPQQKYLQSVFVCKGPLCTVYTL